MKMQEAGMVLEEQPIKVAEAIRSAVTLSISVNLT